MIEYIRKRHEGDSWVVFSELANATGASVSRHADAAALGLWPSHGHALHGYEFKASRGDVQKELKDPRKADAVGQYCDYWWLCITDLSIIDGLVIPETWGILVPRNQVLRVHRKAPKLPAKTITRGFVAAMIRNVTKTWVPKAEHIAVKEKAHAELVKTADIHAKYDRESTQREVEELRSRIKSFEEHSGVSIDRWNAGNVGDAVRLALMMRSSTGRQEIQNGLRNLLRTAEHHERLGAEARETAKVLDEMLSPQDQKELPLDPIPRVGGIHDS